MAYEAGRREFLLNKVLELSLLQQKLLEENRLEELLRSQIEREAVFAEIREMIPADFGTEPLRGLIEEILKADGALCLNMEENLSDIARKLEKVSKGRKVEKAYRACNK